MSICPRFACIPNIPEDHFLFSHCKCEHKDLIQDVPTIQTSKQQNRYTFVITYVTGKLLNLIHKVGIKSVDTIYQLLLDNKSMSRHWRNGGLAQGGGTSHIVCTITIIWKSSQSKPKSSKTKSFNLDNSHLKTLLCNKKAKKGDAENLPALLLTSNETLA